MWEMWPAGFPVYLSSVLGPLDNVRREVLACAACRGSTMVDGATVDRKTVCVVKCTGDSCWYNITTVYLSESVHYTSLLRLG
jgi:hypothetical protein